MHVHFVTFYPLWILDFFFNFLVLLLNNGKIFILNSADEWIWCHPWRKTTIMVWVFSSRVDSALCAIDLRPVFFCHAYTISHRRQPIKDPDQILNRFMSSLWNFGELKGRCLTLSNREWLVLTFFLATLFQSLQISNNKEHLCFLSHPPWHGCLYWMFLDQVNLSAPPCKSRYKTQW